jgi:hexosaminidase
MIIFNRIIFYKVRLSMLLFFCLATFNGVAQSTIVPAIRDWKPTYGKLIMDSDFKIILDAKYFTIIEKDVILCTSAQTKTIFFTLDTTIKEIGEEGYKLEIAQSIKVTAKTSAGIFYACQTLLQIFKQTGNTIEKGIAIDYPTFESRGIMIDAGRRYFQVAYLEDVIRQLAWQKMNTLHMHFTEWSAFRLNSEKYPGLAAKESHTKADVQRLQKFCTKYHIMLVPEIDMPAHASALTDYKPEIAFSCESMRKARWQGDSANNAGKAWAIDVTRPEVRQWLKGLLDEFMPWFDGPYFHIGGDEYQYDPEKYECPELLEGMKKMGYEKPGDVFVDFINDMNQHIRSKGKITQVWNWWRFGKDETTIQPSKDIVINVWNKPRQKFIVEDGYKVIITPEEDLYVTPGLADTSGYGTVKTKVVYESWKPEKRSNIIMGYKVCIWADKAEEQPDNWFEQHSYEPKVVLAEKVWAGAKSSSLADYMKRVQSVGRFPY